MEQATVNKTFFVLFCLLCFFSLELTALTLGTICPFGALTGCTQNGQVDEDVQGIGLHNMHKLFLEIQIRDADTAPLRFYHSK